MEDNHGDDQADDRVEVELPAPGRQPDHQARRNDADVAQGIPEYMQHQGAHVHRPVGVPMPAMPMSVDIRRTRVRGRL